MAAVLNNVSDGKIVCEEEIFQAGNAEDNQNADSHPGIARTFYEKRIACANGENAADYRIRRTDECQKQCE